MVAPMRTVLTDHLICSRPGGRGTHPDRRRAAGRRPAGLARRGAPARARPAALPLPGHGHRLRRSGLDRLQRLPARAPDRDHRPGPDPLRGRPDLGAARDPSGADAGAQPGDRGHDRHRGGHGLRCRVALRPLDARRAAARIGAGRHRRRGDLRAAARVHAQAPPRDDARGRVGLQRPGGDPARARLHRMAAARRLRRRRHGGALRPAARDRHRHRRRGRGRRRLGAAPRDAGHRGPVPGGHARRRRAGLRRRRRAARIGLPRRLSRRARARHAGHPGPADRDLLPPGPRVGGSGGDVRRARAARLPEPPGRRGRARDRARARARVRLAPGRGGGVDAADALHVARAGGARRAPVCAARCPWCSRPSRSSRV